MRTLAFINLKGGTGKTVSAANVALKFSAENINQG